jgi:hypothetical protein
MQNLNINKNAKVYTHTTQVEFDGLPILFIPWICDDNESESIRTIEASQATIAMGHLEIKGFEMHSGHMNEHGQEKSMFKRFEKVMSGHFHKKSDDGHIYYLGTQYEMTWSDYNCPKGFHIFDTETRELSRVYNHINLHAIDVIEDPTDIGASVREDILEQGEDTLTFLGNYIDQVDIKLDKQKLKQFAKELYMEASE